MIARRVGRGLMAALIALAWLDCAPAMARQAQQDPDPSFTATFGLGRMARNGSWCPVRVEITGGAEPIDGVVRIAIGRGVQTDLTIDAPFAATPSKTTFVDFAVPIVASSPHSDQDRWAQVSLNTPERGTLGIARYSEWGTPKTIQMFGSVLDDTQPILLNVGRTTLRNGAAEWAIQSARFTGWTQVTTANELADFLPTLAIGYETIDAIVITQTAFDALDSAQQSAMKDWIVAGGRVLLIAESPSVNLAWLPGGAPARLTINAQSQRPQWVLTDAGEMSGWRVLNLDTPRHADHEEHEDEQSDPTAFDASRGTNAIAHGLVGGGWLTLLAGDPGDIYPWGDKGELWSESLAFTIDIERHEADTSDPWGRPRVREQSRSMNALLNTVADAMDIRSRFPVALFAGVLVLLALAVGPIDRFVLKRLGLSGMAWLSAIIWIGLISTVAYFGPRLFRASSSIQARITAIDINTIDSTAVRSGVAALFAGKSGGRGLLNASADSWWRPVSTSRSDWNREPLSNVTIESTGSTGTRPDRMYMGVWTLNMLADDAWIEPPYTARMIRSDRPLVLEGLPADAEDVLVLWNGRAYNATGPADGRWRLEPGDHLRAMLYGLSLGTGDTWVAAHAQHPRDVTAAVLAMPGPQRRTESFLAAARSQEIALVHFWREPATPDVSFTLSGEREAQRTITREAVRMIVRVTTETEP